MLSQSSTNVRHSWPPKRITPALFSTAMFEQAKRSQGTYPASLRNHTHNDNRRHNRMAALWHCSFVCGRADRCHIFACRLEYPGGVAGAFGAEESLVRVETQSGNVRVNWVSTTIRGI
jgi:hypothetical protein